MEIPKGIELIVPVGLSLGLAVLAFCGFSTEVKDEAYERQNGVCPVCGQPLSARCEGHHKVPKSKGGNNGVANCVMVDGDSRHGRDCHEILDRKALDRGLIFLSPEEPEVPIYEAPVELFRNEAIRERVISGFNPMEREGTIYSHKRKRRKVSHRKGNHGHR